LTTPSSHDISKPITKYPFGSPPPPPPSNDQYNHQKTTKNNEEYVDDNDDEEEDEKVVVEDIYLYTMTHLHPTTFVPTPTASGTGSGTAAAAPAVAATSSTSRSSSPLPPRQNRIFLPSQESLTITPSFSSFHLPQPHRDNRFEMQVQHKATTGGGGGDVFCVPVLPPPPQPLRGQDPIESMSETEAEDEEVSTKPKTRKKCASLAIFRFFLKK
jgi:hypothetical protein